VKRKHYFLLLGLIPLLSAPAVAHAPADAAIVRDPRAISILRQCLKAEGGETALTKIQDFRATGSITYFWGGKEVKGTATMQGRGTEEFSVQATLDEGTRSMVIGKAAGTVSESKSQPTAIPYHNTVNLGALSFPVLSLARALNDSSTSITLVGTASVGQRTAYQIRTQRSFNSVGSAGSTTMSYVSIKDYFLDTTSFLPLATRWMAHPPKDYRQEFPQEILFGDFRAVEGMIVPFSVSETLAGQKTWEFQAESFNVNVGLTESDFEASR
jgi:hypothetical protein